MSDPFSPDHESGFSAWKQGLEAAPLSELLIREAHQPAEDGRWVRWKQADCESTYIHSAEDNASKIGQQLVLLAEIAKFPVGFCCVLASPSNSDPLFIQLVAVVPLARQQGRTGAPHRGRPAQPRRNMAMATLDDNVAAPRSNERFAQSIGRDISAFPMAASSRRI